jgi:hypothetical protein
VVHGQSRLGTVVLKIWHQDSFYEVAKAKVTVRQIVQFESQSKIVAHYSGACRTCDACFLSIVHIVCAVLHTLPWGISASRSYRPITISCQKQCVVHFIM